jgi:hypothetical protein
MGLQATQCSHTPFLQAGSGRRVLKASPGLPQGLGRRAGPDDSGGILMLLLLLPDILAFL